LSESKGDSTLEKSPIVNSVSPESAGQTKRPLWNRRYLSFSPVAIYLVLLLLVQIFGGLAAPIGGFPESCPKDAQNCTRIAQSPFRGDGRDGIRLNIASGEARTAVLDWVEMTPRTGVTVDSVSEIEVLSKTRWMRYPDDMYIRISCEDNLTLVEIHSESRLGVGDMGVNDARVESLASFLESYEYSTVGDACLPLPIA
jgi:uncharacterized protein (DUF1499 family)